MLQIFKRWCKNSGKSQPQPHESERKANNKKSTSLDAKKSTQLQDNEWLDNETWDDGGISSSFLDGCTGLDSS